MHPQPPASLGEASVGVYFALVFASRVRGTTVEAAYCVGKGVATKAGRTIQHTQAKRAICDRARFAAIRLTFVLEI